MAKEKKLFFIATTDKPESTNRRYTEAVRAVLNDSEFFADYMIETHIQSNDNDLYNSLYSAIKNDYYEGYIILLDSIDIDEKNGVWNPNVMFEFGAVKLLEQPFVVMDTSMRDPQNYPFDIANMNVLHIPGKLIEYVHEYGDSETSMEIGEWLKIKGDKALDTFAHDVYKRYKRSYEKHTARQNSEQLIQKKLDQIIEITNFLKDSAGDATAMYIDGEAQAFTALAEAVKETKSSLRTTRFANESIVKSPTQEQRVFMEELYSASNKLKKDFIRIICNNHPTKWLDIYNILLNGGNGSRVYVRKDTFSIHFELVIIDGDITFVHFYQTDNNSNKVPSIEKINSTLKISGSSISKKFTNIYDRLHHRDIENTVPTDPSRTLLGIPSTLSIDDSKKYSNVGYFELPADTPDVRKGPAILRMFRKALFDWEMDKKDKINMVVGIALIEDASDTIDQLKSAGKLSEEEYAEVMELFSENNRWN